MTQWFDLAKDEQGRLVLRRPGMDDVVDVRLRRAFPWSEPGRFLSVRDAEGKELLLIDSLGPLEPGRRTVIERTPALCRGSPKCTTSTSASGTSCGKTGPTGGRRNFACRSGRTFGSCPTAGFGS